MPKASNSIAGGNATGFDKPHFPDPEGVEATADSTLSGSDRILRSYPVALPPAIGFVAFGDSISSVTSTKRCGACFGNGMILFA